MMTELKEIQGKLDVAHQMLQAMCELMNQIAGRKPMDMEWVLQMQARGKRVDI